MGILRNLTILQKRDINGNYSILMQKCPSFNQPALIFEGGAIISVSAEEANVMKRSFTKLLDAYACLGILLDSYEDSKTVLYLVVVVACSSVGKIQNSEIFRITEVENILLYGSRDNEIVKDIKRLFKSGAFYFSHSTTPNSKPYDLSICAQRQSMTDNTDNRFFWNRILFRHFERFNIDTSSWLVKIISGGLNISTVYVGGIQAKACLFSRLSNERAGTRFNVRGVNDLGHVANFVETEQVIFINKTICSFIMIRGSIPLFWEQPGVQVGSHRIKMSRGTEISQPSYDKHMFLLKERYEDVTIVNLLSAKESEILLNQLFNEHHKASKISSQFPFLNFDYHNLCPRGHRENLEKMFVTDLQEHCNRYGIFHSDDGVVRQMQNGVIRVNCLDCLDRTNSFQSFIGMKMLENFSKMIERVDASNVQVRFNDIYSNLWIQNGDQVSRIYAGTGAIEGKNIIKDGALSVARTIQNNLFDDDKQGAIDCLIFGRALNRDYSYRSAALLPYYYTYAPSNLLVKMCDRYLDYCTPEKLKVVVGTWNVNGGRHFDNTNYSRARPISEWLVNYRASVEYGSGEADLINHCESEDPVDLYAIGFQEIVDLNAGNIVASSTKNQLDWLIEIQKTISSKNHSYHLVSTVQLVGVCLFIFVRAPLSPFITDVYNDQVKTGLGGATGNKGGVATRLRYKSTSICFICSHFAAGQNQVKERNDDYAEITRRLQFSMGRSVNSHDYIFWCGDFNYRLDNISNDEVRTAAANNDYELLLNHDQLKLSQAAGKTFKAYIEGPIRFAPTYKYDAFSDDYDSSEKCRIPAYTDRIMFKKRHPTFLDELLTDPNQIKFYNRIELMSSDHRPVVAEFDIDILEVDKSRRRKTFDEVLDNYGPLNSTVTVQLEGSLPTNNEVIESILKLFVDEAGQIVVSRFIGNVMVVIFHNGQAALKALKLNDYTLAVEGVGKSRLIIDLKTPNWRQDIYKELLNNMDNCVNLVSGEEPTIHIEDDEDEAAQELNLSIGPHINSEQLRLISIDFLVPQEKEASSTGPTPEPPQRPPPPSPSHISSNVMKMKPPSRAPPPIPNSRVVSDINQIGIVSPTSNLPPEISMLSLDDFSSSFEELPPPMIKPPALPPRIQFENKNQTQSDGNLKAPPIPARTMEKGT